MVNPLFTPLRARRPSDRRSMGDVRSVGQKYRVWRKENSDQRELVYNMGLHFFIAFSSPGVHYVWNR
jgi:hypothetical protein